MALRSRGRRTSGRAVRIRAVLPWCRRRRPRAGDQRPGRPEEQRSDTRRHSHPLSLIICASSMINFPSLYFWLDSKACSCNRREGAGHGGLQLHGEPLTVPLKRMTRGWWTTAAGCCPDFQPGPRHTHTHAHKRLGSARLASRLARHAVSAGIDRPRCKTEASRASPAAQRDTERAAPGGGAGGRWEGR